MKPFRWQPHLQPGEVLLWQGRPYPAMALIRPTQTEGLLGALGAVAAVALVILDRALPDTGAATGPLGWVMLALLLVALLVAGIPFRQMRQRSMALKRTHYAVTDRRVLVVADARRPGTLTAWRLPATATPQLADEGHRLSTLSFGGDSPPMAHLRDGEAIARAISLGREAEAKARRS